MIIDIGTVGIAVNGVYGCTQFGENGGSNFVGGTVCTIQHNLHPFQALILRKRLPAKCDIPVAGITDAVRDSNLIGRRPYVLDPSGKNQIFYLIFLRIRKLETISRKYFDAVILIGIMTCRHNHAGIRPHAAGDECNPGSAHRSRQIHVDSH